jgi:hypothetical protein
MPFSDFVFVSEPHEYWGRCLYCGANLGSRLIKKLDTCDWHVLRIIFADNRPQAETYEEVMKAKIITANAAKKLVAKSWCARRIVWDNGQAGIAADVSDTGYYILMPTVTKAEANKP